jgi:hypothetical protein
VRLLTSSRRSAWHLSPRRGLRWRWWRKVAANLELRRDKPVGGCSYRPQSACPTGARGSQASPRQRTRRELPDGLVPSEAKVRGLASEPASPARGKPVGGCRGRWWRGGSCEP